MALPRLRRGRAVGEEEPIGGAVSGSTRRIAAGLGATAAIAALLLAGPASAPADTGSARKLQADPPRAHARPATASPLLARNPAQSPWKRLANAAPFVPGTMLLASDGTVLVHNEPETGATEEWFRLTPDAKGSYVDGTWSKIASMPAGYAPLYFASAILPDGRMIVEGGEYNGSDPEGVWTNLGAIYNPVSNSWRRVAPPPGWTNIGDAQSEVLANGTFMLSQACQECLSEEFVLSTDDALLNASGLSWNVIPANGKNDPNDEEGWSLEPDGRLLTVDTWLTPSTELFTPSKLSWSSAGNTIASPVDSPEAEVGPQVAMPGGNTFVIGAGTSSEIPPEACTVHKAAATALYNFAAAKWVKSPPIPTIEGLQNDSADGPAAVLPDGNVLFDVSPCVYNAPLSFDVYDAAANTISSVADVRNAANDSTYYTRLLDLPNGQVLFDDGSETLEVYTAGGAAKPSWAPSVSSLSSTTLVPGKTATLSGSQLAGLDQGTAYGDDVQNNTNFPLVRVTNDETGVVTYARTSNWTSVSTAPGTPSSTQFTLPKTAPAGAAKLEVVANGIASAAVPVTVK